MIVLDHATEYFLQRLIRQEGRSLLQYVREATPQGVLARHPLGQIVGELAAEEEQSAEELSRWLLARRGRPPFLGAYPTSFTSVNFVSLEAMLPRLVEFQKSRVADLSEQLGGMLDEDARAKVRQILETKRRHLVRLESAATTAGAAS